MENTYKEFLEAEYNRALENFEAVRAEVLKDVEQMTANRAFEYGAAYASGIERMTAAAGKINAIGNQLRAYEHYKLMETLEG